mgnify:FL=1
MEERIVAHSKALYFKLKYFIMIVGVWVFQLWSTNRLYEYNLSYVKNNDLRWEYLKQTGFKHSVSDEQLASALVKSDMDTIRWLFLLVYVVIIVLWLYGLRTEITVSNKRIYGRNGMGKQVDLPLDSISSVRTSSNKGIKVSSYSGNIKFPFLRSQKEVYEAICGLLVDRQSMPVAPVVPQKESASSVSNADEIKKYKELLDLGIITQEEFDVKKKQYLDL